MKRFLSLLLAILMIFGLCACGNDPVAEETGGDVTAEVEDLYTEKTYNVYDPEGKAFFTTSEIPQYEELPTKNITGLRLAGLNSKFAFSANCEGVVRLYLWTSSLNGEAHEIKVKVTIDGVESKTLRITSAGGNLIIADSLLRGEHSIEIEKLTGGTNLYIGSVTLRGEITEPPLLSKKDGLVVEVFAPAGGDDEYSCFNIYTQTTHPSGDYYIKYNFVYEYDPITPTLNWSNGSNTGANRSNYRIKTAQIVKRTGDTTFTTVYEILQGGEISLAIKEYDPIEQKAAGDFVGGFHGDENLNSVSLVLDGNQKIDLYDGEAGFYTCTSAKFTQHSTINRCHTNDDYVMNHKQNYLIDTNGIKLLQQIEWLVDDFTPSKGASYIQMFTLYRTNPANQSEYLTDTIYTLDENGNRLDMADITLIDPGDAEGIAIMSSPDARYAEYYGNQKGIYAKVGFAFVDNSCHLNEARISVRKHGDSKWYPSFGDPKDTPAKGDVWTINSIYYIDYNPAE